MYKAWRQVKKKQRKEESGSEEETRERHEREGERERERLSDRCRKRKPYATSWEIDGETVETVSDFIFLGSKITTNGDCSHEIKRRLLLVYQLISFSALQFVIDKS